MNEAFIAYIWFNHLYFEEQTTLLNEKVEIISTGVPNNNAGPDAFNAKIKIDGKLWAGNVEFHVNASDWHRHHHDGNPAYQNIILHVVLNADEQLVKTDSTPIPTIAIKFPEFIRNNYNNLTSTSFGCDSRISNIEPIVLTSWLERLVVERLESKINNLEYILERTTNDWDEALYVLLARAFGTGVNSEAMQQLALSVPLKYLRHHADSDLIIQSALLGQAGLISALPSNFNKDLITREYNFFANKYSLQPAQSQFKFSRMRPNNFPTFRIIEFARIIPDLPSIESLINGSTLNMDRIKRIPLLQLINCFLPLLFHYATIHDLPQIQDQVLDCLHSLPAEHNFITRHFEARGIKVRDAAESQAVIQLYRNYCEKHDCLRCRLAHSILTIQQ